MPIFPKTFKWKNGDLFLSNDVAWKEKWIGRSFSEQATPKEAPPRWTYWIHIGRFGAALQIIQRKKDVP